MKEEMLGCLSSRRLLGRRKKGRRRSGAQKFPSTFLLTRRLVKGERKMERAAQLPLYSGQ